MEPVVRKTVHREVQHNVPAMTEEEYIDYCLDNGIPLSEAQHRKIAKDAQEVTVRLIAEGKLRSYKKEYPSDYEKYLYMVNDHPDDEDSLPRMMTEEEIRAYDQEVDKRIAQRVKEPANK